MELLSSWIADFIYFVGRQSQTFWLNLELLDYSAPQMIIDILLVSIIFYYIFLLLQGSRAVNVLMGLGMVTIIYVISRTAQLVTLNWIMDKFFTVALVAIPVIFQKELRMGLEKLGHAKLFVSHVGNMQHMVSKILAACLEMADQKTGALIVLQAQTPLKEYIETGIGLNADVSKELLLTIFGNKSPLHDGAVIITGERIEAASCVLPHSLEKTSGDMGTRHKAALGLSDVTDALIVVVSEERGIISFAKNGKMEKNISPQRLKNILETHLKIKTANEISK